MIIGAVKLCQGGTAREIQAGQLVAVAVKLCQGGVLRHVQAGQFIVGAFKRCHIASDGDRLARKPVELFTIIILLTSLLGSFNGDVAIGFDVQSDFPADSFGSGHGDDAFGEERAGREQRAQEGEEPDE